MNPCCKKFRHLNQSILVFSLWPCNMILGLCIFTLHVREIRYHHWQHWEPSDWHSEINILSQKIIPSQETNIWNNRICNLHWNAKYFLVHFYWEGQMQCITNRLPNSNHKENYLSSHTTSNWEEGGWVWSSNNACLSDHGTAHSNFFNVTWTFWNVAQDKILLLHFSKISYYIHHRFYSYEGYSIHVA